MTSQKKLPAAFALAAASLSWGAAPVFIRGLSGAYDPYTQAFFRYGCGAAPLVVITLCWHRGALRRPLLASMGIIGVSVLNVAQQWAWTYACYLGTATLVQLLSKLSAVFVIIFSYCLFSEERAVIKTRAYQLGTVLSLVGVLLVLCRDPSSLAPRFDAATGLALLVAVLWGGYVVWSKHLVLHMHPIPMFAVVAVYTTIGFGPLAFLFGEPRCIIEAGTKITLIAAVSGFICISLAHPCYNYAQKVLGAALCSSLNLLNPLFTNALGLAFWADERLAPVQWGGAAALLGGTMLVTLAGQRFHRDSRGRRRP